MSKPIRVFWSPLSQRFYASRAYKEVKPGVVEITGDKFDVTGDIAQAILQHSITFTPKPEPTDATQGPEPQHTAAADHWNVTCPHCSFEYTRQVHTVCPKCFCWPNGDPPGPPGLPKWKGPKLHG